MVTKARAGFKPIDQVSPRSEKMKATPMDHHVGSRIRYRRAEIGMSMETLARQLPASRQQVEKYEKGVTRITCGLLYDFAVILNVPPSFFMDEFKAGPTITGSSTATAITPAVVALAVQWERLPAEDQRALQHLMDRLGTVDQAPETEAPGAE